MTAPATSKGLLRTLVYPLLKPIYYPTRHYYRLFRLRSAGLNFPPAQSISMDCSHSELAERMKAAVSPRVHWRQIALDRGPIHDNVDSYFQSHRETYEIDKGRGKALEHALGLELLDFSRVKRYCDVASCASPIQKTFAAHYPQVEFWKQDLTYQDDLPHLQLGGFAQSMTSIPNGFFDAMTLHNSFEHFMGSADSDFMAVDRVLSPIGACLILPLNVALTHRIYFDPVAVTSPLLRTYDKGADLISVRGFANQEHARCYDAAHATGAIDQPRPFNTGRNHHRFHRWRSVAAEMFPEFALVLHRPQSVLCPS